MPGPIAAGVIGGVATGAGRVVVVVDVDVVVDGDGGGAVVGELDVGTVVVGPGTAP